MTGRLVRCINCDVEWNPNRDPPGCTEGTHGHSASFDGGATWTPPLDRDGHLVHRDQVSGIDEAALARLDQLPDGSIELKGKFQNDAERERELLATAIGEAWMEARRIDGAAGALGSDAIALYTLLEGLAEMVELQVDL